MSDRVEDRIPEWVRGELGSEEAREVEAYLEHSADARAEESVIRAMRESTVPVPEGLEARIKSAVASAQGTSAAPATVRSRRTRIRVGWLSAAAALMITVTVGVFWSGRGIDPLTDEELTALDPLGEVWTSEDNVVAGAPLLEGLSDEALAQLLDELGG